MLPKTITQSLVVNPKQEARHPDVSSSQSSHQTINRDVWVRSLQNMENADWLYPSEG